MRTARQLRSLGLVYCTSAIDVRNNAESELINKRLKLHNTDLCEVYSYHDSHATTQHETRVWWAAAQKHGAPSLFYAPPLYREGMQLAGWVYFRSVLVKVVPHLTTPLPQTIRSLGLGRVLERCF